MMTELMVNYARLMGCIRPSVTSTLSARGNKMIARGSLLWWSCDNTILAYYEGVTTALFQWS